jgi:hypothetical protein
MKSGHLVFTYIFLCFVAISFNRASAQGCAVTLQSHFSTYRTVSVNGYRLTQTVRIEGYASVFPGPGCPMQSAVHTPKVYNKLGTIGGWYSGSSQCASCYVYFSKPLDIVGAPGVVYTTGSDSSMACSMIGTFFDAGMMSGQSMQLIGGGCTGQPPYPYYGDYAHIGGSCFKTDYYPLPGGGQCINVGTTPAGTPKVCYQTSVNGCQITYCNVDNRLADAACTKFIDQGGYTVATVPAGCQQ